MGMLMITEGWEFLYTGQSCKQLRWQSSLASYVVVLRVILFWVWNPQLKIKMMIKHLLWRTGACIPPFPSAPHEMLGGLNVEAEREYIFKSTVGSDSVPETSEDTGFRIVKCCTGHLAFWGYICNINKYFIFIVPCIVIFYGMTNRCNNVQWVYFSARVDLQRNKLTAHCCICWSFHRINKYVCTCILIRSNKMQQYGGIYLLQNHFLHVSGVHRTHYQENIKL